MFFRILRKDMKVRKSVNFILFLFIALASVFLASSASNIVVVGNAIDYYMDYANMPDVILIASRCDEREQIQEWLKEVPDVDAYGYEQLLTVTTMNMSIIKDGKEKSFKLEGADPYIGAQGMYYCKVYDMDGKDFHLNNGEIALGKHLMEMNDLHIGDKMLIRIGTVEKEVVIKNNTKDASFGMEMSGMQRLIISEEDYEQLAKASGAEIMDIHCVETKDDKAVVNAVNEQDFTTINLTHTRDTYELLYVFELIVAALLILIGICLILIALLVLRFALVFTIEEDYREIGIMKAIGMRNFDIKKLYMVKYFFLVVLGAVVGLLASIPVSQIMIDSVSQNMIMENSSSKLWINLLCTAFVIAFVLLFCYGCTRKLNKISTIAAMRGGQTGERYGRRMGVALYKRRKMPVVCFMGLNDIACHLKRYMILLFTFCVSFILITIPLNTLNTMRSREMVQKFAINPDSSVYVRKIEQSGKSPSQEVGGQNGEKFHNSGEVMEGLERLREELHEKGYKDAKLTVTPIYFMRYHEINEKTNINIMTIQPLGDVTDYLVYDDGKPPKLENEIAFSEQVMELYGWKLGDSVEASINGERKKFIITGTYTDYMQLGMSARMNSAIDCSAENNMFDYWTVMVKVDTDKSQQEMVKEMKEKFPEYEWLTAQELIDRSVGSIQDTMDKMLLPMTGMLCALIMLITILMERLFIVREKGEIAMLKSIGYKNRDIRLWQVIRLAWVALFSLILSVPLSMLSNTFVLKPIFKIMGAEVQIQVVPWQVYGVYPAVLMAGIVLAAIIATRKVRNIHIKDM